MADVSLEAPAEPAPLPQKDWWKSNSMWAAIVAVVAGLMSQNGGMAEIANYINVNKDALVGWVLQGVGFFGAFAALRRTTTLKIGK